MPLSVGKIANYLEPPSLHFDQLSWRWHPRPPIIPPWQGHSAEYVEFEVRRALEWLGADRNEGRDMRL